MSERAKHWLWAAAIGAVLLLVLNTYVVGVYHVDTGSMEPTILGTRQGGERVLVRYDRSPPQRFDLVVVMRPGEDVPIVKRVAGLPGEKLQIVEGDLLIQGRRLPPDAPRPRPFAVFDDRWQKSEDFFSPAQPGAELWRHADNEWLLDASSAGGAKLTGRLNLRADVKDSYLDHEHLLVAGETSVNDLQLELELRPGAEGSCARLGLSEEGDVFELALDSIAKGRVHASLLRRGEAQETLAEAELESSGSAWQRVLFSNIDNALVFEWNGRRILQQMYAENRLAPQDRLQEGRNYTPRVYLGGEGATIGFRAIRIARDLYYTQRGPYWVKETRQLDPGQYLLLGDNSASSRDGREWGATQEQELLGRPIFVLWPLSHWRVLEGACPPASPLR